MFYLTVFYVVTFFHNLCLSLCELMDRFKPVFSKAISAVELSANYADTLLLKSTGKEFTRQKKMLPMHLACLFVDECIDIEKIVMIVKWCAATGIRCISLYDHAGNNFQSKAYMSLLINLLFLYQEILLHVTMLSRLNLKDVLPVILLDLLKKHSLSTKA